MSAEGSETIQVRLTVSGRVQGVWYRGWTVRTARELGLDGWVRNRSDGSVEMVLRGLASAIEQMIALCREGPEAARVDGIERQADNGSVEPGFEQRPTL